MTLIPGFNVAPLQNKVLVGIGGSVTQGLNSTSAVNSYLGRIGAYLSLADMTRWTVTNSGHSGMGAWTHLINLQTECIDLAPDRVILDCAVNDGYSFAGNTEEALIRRIRTALPEARIFAINFISVSDRNGTDTTNLAETSNARLKTLYGYYGIPVADYVGEVQRAVTAEEQVLSWYFTTDDIHPSDNGHLTAKNLLTAIFSDGAQWSGTLPNRIHDNGDYENEPIIRTGIQRDSVTGTWSEDGTAIQSSEENATVTFTDTCQSWGPDVGFGVGYGVFDWRMDGGSWQAERDTSTFGYSGWNYWTSEDRGIHTFDIRVKSGLIKINRFLAV